MLSLRGQVCLFAVLLTGSALLVFGSLLQLSNVRLEATMLDALVENEAQFFASLIGPGEALPVLPALAGTSTWFDRGDHVQTPSELRALPLGISHDVWHDGSRWHVLRRAHAQGVLTVALQIGELKAKERQFSQVLLWTGIALLLVSGLVGFVLAGVAARPFFRLANQIDRLEVGAPHDPIDSNGVRESRVIIQAFNRYAIQLQSALRREQRFAAAASHEMRSPLTVVGGSLELISADANLSDSTRRALRRAQTAQHELEQTTEALLMLAREPGPPLLDGVDLGAVSRSVLAELAEHEPDQLARVQSVLSDEPVVQPVPERHWRIVMNNLIRNALQHAPQGPIRLVLDNTGLVVEDEGPGINEVDLQAMFEPGVRSPSSAGAGLGLYIVAELAQRHAWAVRARNRPEGGLRLEIAFPGAVH